jgi:putative glutamine amidotransferase
MSKPLVLLTCASKQRTQGLLRLDDVAGHNYSDAVLEAGGLPLVVSNVPPHYAEAYIDRADAVIFSGGEDIDPEFFNADPHPNLGLISRIRDEFELELYRHAKAKGIPILGVCRGIQLINVAEGGGLHQHVPALDGAIAHGQRNIAGDNFHTVTLAEGSMLAEALGATTMRTNSFHHQAVSDLGQGLRVTGTTADGVIEAIEGTDEQFILGVQWHPEMNFRRDAKQHVIFQLLMDAVSRRQLTLA